MSHCFTPQSAQRALARIRPAAERMCRLYSHMQAQRPARIEPDQRVAPGYYRLLRAFHAAVRQIRIDGARVRDARRGLVDFPARRGGRDVLLCWRVGEPQVAFWHEVGPGQCPRQPVVDEDRWDEP